MTRRICNWSCLLYTSQNPYLDAIIRGVNMDAIRSRELHIILDPMYGVSRTSDVYKRQPLTCARTLPSTLAPAKVGVPTSTPSSEPSLSLIHI